MDTIRSSARVVRALLLALTATALSVRPAHAQRPIPVGTSPWGEVGAELGELRLPLVEPRDGVEVLDVASRRGRPLLLLEFAAW